MPPSPLLLTFDDGYYNNIRALPVLEEFNVPAVFFVSTEHVKQNKCFWWDVLHRERAAQGASFVQIYREGLAFKAFRTEQIEEALKKRFGPQAFFPRGDLDRRHQFNANRMICLQIERLSRGRNCRQRAQRAWPGEHWSCPDTLSHAFDRLLR